MDERPRKDVISSFQIDYPENWEKELSILLETSEHEMFSHMGSQYPIHVFCERFGWWCNAFIADNAGPFRITAAGLRTFDINDEDETALAISEVCSHLARNYSDIYSLSASHFEQVVANIYLGIGWDVEVTPQS